MSPRCYLQAVLVHRIGMIQVQIGTLNTSAHMIHIVTIRPKTPRNFHAAEHPAIPVDADSLKWTVADRAKAGEGPKNRNSLKTMRSKREEKIIQQIWLYNSPSLSSHDHRTNDATLLINIYFSARSSPLSMTHPFKD